LAAYGGQSDDQVVNGDNLTVSLARQSYGVCHGESVTVYNRCIGVEYGLEENGSHTRLRVMREEAHLVDGRQCARDGKCLLQRAGRGAHGVRVGRQLAVTAVGRDLGRQSRVRGRCGA
jgi:hypothetical protein